MDSFSRLFASDSENASEHDKQSEQSEKNNSQPAVKTTPADNTNVEASLRFSNTGALDTPYINPESVANFALATLIASTLTVLTIALDIAGYEMHHLLDNEHVNMRKFADDAFIPEIGSMIFGIGAWFVFLNRGLGGKLSEQTGLYSYLVNDDNNLRMSRGQYIDTTYSHWKARAAIVLIFLTNTLLGFAIDHFFLRHSSTYKLTECIWSKLLSLAGAIILCGSVLAMDYFFNTQLIETLIAKLNNLHLSIQDKVDPYIGVNSEWQEQEKEKKYRNLLTDCCTGLFFASGSRSSSQVVPASEKVDSDTTALLNGKNEGVNATIGSTSDIESARTSITSYKREGQGFSSASPVV